MLVGFYLPLQENNQASSSSASCVPQGVALPILNCAAWLEHDGNISKRHTHRRLAGRRTPFRATAAENILRGQIFNVES